SGGLDRTVRLWDLAAGTEIRTLSRHDAPVNGVTFSPDGKLLASASLDHTLVLWDVASGRRARTLTGYSLNLLRHVTVAFSPDGRTVAAGGEDGLVHFWDVASGGKPRESLPWHVDRVRAVAYRPDGALIATAGDDGRVQLRRAATGERVATFALPSKVTRVAFSPDGRTLAAACDSPDRSLHLWDVATRVGVVFRGHTNNILGLAFSPGGRVVATAAPGGTLRFWARDGGGAGEGGGRRPRPGGRPRFAPDVGAVAFTRGGRSRATANETGAIAVLKPPAPPRPYVPGPSRPLPGPPELAKRPCPADALDR